MTVPIRSMPVADETIVVLRRHQDFAEVFRIMKERWGLTNNFIDDAGGLAKGQADKYLGPSGVKNWGPQTFDLFCEILAIEFHAKVDIEAAKRMAEVWDGRQPRWFPEEKMNARVSKKLLARAKPLVFKENGRIGGLVRSHLLTPKQRSDIARKGGKAKHRKRKATARAARSAKASPAEPCERGRRSSRVKHTICVSSAG